MNKLFFMAGLFFLAAITFQFRHDIADSFGGLTDSAKRSQIEFNKLAHEIFPGKPYSGPESPGEALALKKEPDKPVVYILYGAALLFLFGGMMKSSETNRGDKNQTKSSE
jgi:hypothetical protein